MISGVTLVDILLDLLFSHDSFYKDNYLLSGKSLLRHRKCSVCARREYKITQLELITITVTCSSCDWFWFCISLVEKLGPDFRGITNRNRESHLKTQTANHARWLLNVAYFLQHSLLNVLQNILESHVSDNNRKS